MTAHKINVSKILKKYRKKNKLTQVALAKLLGVSQGQVNKWEKEVHHPSFLRWLDIEAKLKI